MKQVDVSDGLMKERGVKKGRKREPEYTHPISSPSPHPFLFPPLTIHYPTPLVHSPTHPSTLPSTPHPAKSQQHLHTHSSYSQLFAALLDTPPKRGMKSERLEESSFPIWTYNFIAAVKFGVNERGNITIIVPPLHCSRQRPPAPRPALACPRVLRRVIWVLAWWVLGVLFGLIVRVCR